MVETAPVAAMSSAGQRHGPDRRKSGGSVLNRYTLFGGRRRGARRADERVGYIADTHGWGLFLVVTVVATLNILDAFFTMIFLSHGGQEINPFVDMVLRWGGVWLFILVKSVGIGVCIIFLTLTKNFLVSRVGLALVLIGYSALLGWHFHLLGTLPSV